MAAAYTKKVNLVLVGDDVGACFDAAADNYRSCEYMERAVARKWLGSDLIFVSESDFFAKNSWIRNGEV